MISSFSTAIAIDIDFKEYFLYYSMTGGRKRDTFLTACHKVVE